MKRNDLSVERRRFLKQASMATAAIAVGGPSALAGHTPQPASRKTVFKTGETGHAAPEDHGKALINPGMGWTMHFYSNVPQNYGSKLAPSDAVDYFPGLSTVYLRLPWAFLEPEEGRFNWEMLDTPAQRWIEKGKKVAFRITSTENWMPSGTPEWVYRAGAKSYQVDKYLEPDYDDPVFLEKVENFVRAMAERYDGNPDTAFVDIGHYGMWGEGHTVMTTPKHGRSWGLEVMKKHIDLYCRHFKKTLLCISDDFAGHDLRGERFPITDYAFSRGVSLRDDSILVNRKPNSWYHSEMAQLFWPAMPVILEHEHYGSSVQRGAWHKELLLQSVEEYHASYMSIHWWPEVLLEENREVIDRINRRMGYRLQMTELQWPDKVRIGEPFPLRSQWRNAGVAPCYGGGYPCFTLKDAQGGIVSVLTDSSFNLKTLPVAQPGQTTATALSSSFAIAPAFGDYSRACQPGTYDLFFSAGKPDGTPLYELPYSDSDGHKRYHAGKITLTERS
ncbi:MAG: DUF4832 domain-containing protein [Tannerella sp.]|jgi:hypothetical protein|nr:DUF4832 domain-containing protein [Tannerella sp.]